MIRAVAILQAPCLVDLDALLGKAFIFTLVVGASDLAGAHLALKKRLAGRRLNLYYKKKAIRTNLDEKTKGFLKEQLDLSLKVCLRIKTFTMVAICLLIPKIGPKAVRGGCQTALVYTQCSPVGKQR